MADERCILAAVLQALLGPPNGIKSQPWLPAFAFTARLEDVRDLKLILEAARIAHAAIASVKQNCLSIESIVLSRSISTIESLICTTVRHGIYATCKPFCAVALHKGDLLNEKDERQNCTSKATKLDSALTVQNALDIGNVCIIQVSSILISGLSYRSIVKAVLGIITFTAQVLTNMSIRTP